MNDSPDSLLIGVDGGGTGCRVAVGTDKDGIQIEATGGRANATTDIEDTVANIRVVVHTAIRQAGREPEALEGAFVHLGLAGVLTRADADSIAAALPHSRCTVTDDRPTAVMGALGGGEGFLVSIGTGTIVAARKSGRFRYVGGWGLHLSDQGSGAWLGRAALSHVLQCHDGLLGHTDLTRSLYAQFGNDPNAIVAFSVTAKPGDYGSFAPQVVTAAQNGDAIGRALMDEGAAYIARALTVVGFHPGDPLCLTGGVGPHYSALLPDEMTRQIQPPKGTAVQGAFRLAQLACQQATRPQA